MSDNAARLWIQDTQNQVAIKQAAAALERFGNALPCRVTAVSGSIVTVTFEVNADPWTLPPVTLPKAEGPWIRSPTQVGDFGVTMPADVYLGGISGLGGGVANTTRRGNMTSLVWVPVASTKFSSVNINAAYICGPEGAVIQDQQGKSIVTISNDGTITLKAAAIVLDGVITQTNTGGAGGNVTLIGPVNVTNDVTAEGTSVHTHVHTGVQPGSGDTGPPA